MGLVNTALHIGRSAISSYQSALSVVGNNIANAADPDYTRQQAVLESVVGGPLPEGLKPGGGVALDSLQRVINEALEGRLRDAIGDSEAAKAESALLGEMESLFDELGENGLSARLNELFRAFQDIQNLPNNVALRGVAIDQVAAIGDVIKGRFDTVSGLVDGINSQVEIAVQQADQLASEIAELNIAISESETNGHTDSILRDSRDARLRDLAELMDITVRHHEGGTVSVFIGTEALVQLGHTRGLDTRLQVEDGVARVQAEFKDGLGEVAVTGGKIGGLLKFRESQFGAVIGDLNHFASNLIASMNIAHADGRGLEGFTQLKGATSVDGAGVPLDEALAGMPVVPRSGSFVMSVSDASSGELLDSVVLDVRLDGGADDTTLTSLAGDITTAVSGVSARVSPDNALVIEADPGVTFSFGHDATANRQDTSNVLAALGVNTLLTGTGAGDIGLNRSLDGSPELLAVSGTDHTGDTTNVARLIDLQTAGQDALDGNSLGDFYDAFVIRVSGATSDVRQREALASDLEASLRAQRDSISGVNLDEEAVNLIKYERAFQGAARYTTVVDQMISEMLNIVR